jgi:ribosome biogenesis GTPase / thiamine phosphate phosphatase
MIEIDVEPLRSIGLTQPVLQHLYRSLLESSCEPPLRLMRLTEVHRETVRLHDGHVERGARLLPRLARTLDEAGDAPAVGDWVVAGSDAHGDFWLHERLPPLTRLARRDADGRRHALVSNVDTALFVMGLDDDFNPRRLERYFALVHGSGMLAVVVLSKADAAAPAGVTHALDALRGRVPAGVEVLAVDARCADAALALAPWLGGGQTLVVLGSSGAGKSTLTNTLLGRAQQDTGAVREHDGRGKHTTTARSLHRLPGGACLIDTPGLRALRPDADASGVAASFGDIEALAPLCRFRDCRHGDEPGCAVRAGVPADRLRNFHKLLREARRDGLTVLQRREQLALWKARGREGHARLKAKRGES